MSKCPYHNIRDDNDCEAFSQRLSMRLIRPYRSYYVPEVETVDHRRAEGREAKRKFIGSGEDVDLSIINGI